MQVSGKMEFQISVWQLKVLSTRTEQQPLPGAEDLVDPTARFMSSAWDA
jgi:hypothetical protein